MIDYLAWLWFEARMRLWWRHRPRTRWLAVLLLAVLTTAPWWWPWNWGHWPYHQAPRIVAGESV